MNIWNQTIPKRTHVDRIKSQYPKCKNCGALLCRLEESWCRKCGQFHYWDRKEKISHGWAWITINGRKRNRTLHDNNLFGGM